MYSFDRSHYARRLATATGDDERRDALACRWEAIKFAVGHCDVVAGHGIAFSRSMRFWQREDGEEYPSLQISDDCNTDVTKEGMPLIHIRGDLDSTLTVTGLFCEIVIGGTILPRAGITGDGFVNVFVGGDVAGFVRNTGMSVIWIDGDMRGEIATGEPMTNLHVMGDFAGTLKPIREAAFLHLEVRGFMSLGSLEAISSYRYTQFHATIGASDQPEGIHPGQGFHRRDEGRSSFRRWIVHSNSPSR
jgi:hypothetical protein